MKDAEEALLLALTAYLVLQTLLSPGPKSSKF